MRIEFRRWKFANSRAVACGVLIAFSAVAMTGCGGGGKGGSSQAAATGQQSTPTPSPTPTPTPTPEPTPTPVQNQAPTISGNVLTAVNAGSTYSFVPTATDADGDPLTFTITNKPAWAAFTAATGALSGAPGAGDVGTYSNISISVSDGKTTTTMNSFAITVNAIANGRATLSWSAPTQNTDGSALTDLSGYTIRYGTSPASLTQTINISNASVTVYVVENLSPTTWYFAITARNGSGAESANSSVASKTI